MWLTNSKSGESFLMPSHQGSHFRLYSKVIIARVWIKSTLSFPRSERLSLTPFWTGRSWAWGGGYGSSLGLLKTKRETGPSPSDGEPSSCLPPPGLAETLCTEGQAEADVFTHLAVGSTIMKSGCTVVNSTFIYISHSYHIYINCKQEVTAASRNWFSSRFPIW